MEITVPASGPTPCDVLLVGKAPGREELSAQRPFVGRAGREHRTYCHLHNLPPYSFRLTNLCRTFVPPDQRLTTAQIAEWTPDLLAEISRTNPRLIVPIGADPVRWFLGDKADLNTVHGIPHRPGEFDPGVAYRAPIGACILPIIQPAAGFHDPDSRALINWDYGQIARVWKLIKEGREGEIDYRHDEYAGCEVYRDVTGRELRNALLKNGVPWLIALDSEGTPSDPFSPQICIEPGVAYILRIDQLDFMGGIKALQYCADHGSIFTGHNLGMYDLEMCRRAFHLDISRAKCHDTLFDAYLFCLEPLGLKPNSWRTLGMHMRSHSETVGGLGVELQVQYLQRVVDLTKGWGRPDPIFEQDNSGAWKIKLKPQPIANRAMDVLRDGDVRGWKTTSIGAEVEDDDDDQEEKGNKPVDPRARWLAIRKDLPDLARRVEHELGHLPYGTMRRLYERDPEAAILYSCRDADAHFRLYHPFMERLEREGKMRLAEVYSTNMHVFSTMQETGMPVKRSKLRALRDRMSDEMLRIVAEIAAEYNDGVPFNPKSPLQTNALLKKWGLEGTKKTKKGAMSSGKKSIEHLKFISDNMTPEEIHRRNLVVKILEWRGHQHTRDMFCKPTLEQLEHIPEDQDECFARCQLIPWGTKQRRSATKRPNLLAQPKHSKFGKWIRDCFEAPDGYVILESDLSSIEVCVMAHVSRDPDLTAILKSGKRFHQVTASRLFAVPFETVTDPQYKVGKRTIFLTFYGGSGPGLKDQLWMEGLTQYGDDDAQDFIDGVKYRVYPAIGKLENAIGTRLKTPHKRLTPDELMTAGYGASGGIVSDMWGMERHVPGIFSEDRGVRAEAQRFGLSLVVSGGAQGLIQESIAWLKPQIESLRAQELDVRWLLTQHDSLIQLVPEWAVGIVKEIVEEGLTEHCGTRLRVPVRAETKVAKTWGQL